MTAQMEKDLQEERNRIWLRMTELQDRLKTEERDFTAEEGEEWDKLESDLQEKSKDLRAAEQNRERNWRWEQMQEVAERRASLNQAAEVLKDRIDPTGTDEYRKAWLHWMRYGRDGLDSDLKHVLRHGFARDSDRSINELRAQTVTTTGGGYLIPAGFRAELMRAMAAFGGMRANSRVITTQEGNSLDIPNVNDTSNTGRLLAINTTVTTTDIAVGQVTLDAYKFTSDQVLVPVELMEDSAFDMGGMVTSLLAERLARNRIVLHDWNRI